MKSKIVKLTSELIKIESTNRDQTQLTKVISLVQKQFNKNQKTHYYYKGIPSLLVSNNKNNNKKFKVILNAHLDVIEGKKEQFIPYIKREKLYGRGALDMKAAAAVEILLFNELAGQVNYPLGLQLVTDEEIGGFNGTKHQVEKGVRAEFVIAGEPTDLAINNIAKGLFWIKINTKGKSGHGAYVWQGDNALWKIQKILTRLNKFYPLPVKAVWKTTINLAKIETNNQTFNKIPDKASMLLDIRYIPGDEDMIINHLKSIIGSDGEMSIMIFEPAQYTNQNNSYVKTLQKITSQITKNKAKIIVKHGSSDIRHFNRVGCDGVTFGPVGGGMHSDNEWVSIKSLENYYQILKTFLLSL